MFEDDYASILSHAKIKVGFFQLNIEPEDLVNSAFVNLYDKPYSIGLFTREITNLALTEKYGPNHIPFGVKGPSEGDFTGDNTCKDCKKTMPVSEFSIYGSRGRKYLRNICKKCVAKRNAKSAKKCTAPEVIKEWNRVGFNKYVGRNRLKWKKYLKDRYNDDKANLSDAYVIKLLRGKYGTKFLSDNPHLVIEKRAALLAKNKKSSLANG